MVFAIIVSFVVPTALVVVLFSWARKVNRAAIAPRFARMGAYVLVAFATLVLVVASGVLVILSVATGPASEHSRNDFDGGVKNAQVLDGAIATTLYVGLAAIVAAVPAAAWLAATTWWKPWRSRRGGADGPPPYR